MTPNPTIGFEVFLDWRWVLVGPGWSTPKFLLVWSGLIIFIIFASIGGSRPLIFNIHGSWTELVQNANNIWIMDQNYWSESVLNFDPNLSDQSVGGSIFMSVF